MGTLNDFSDFHKEHVRLLGKAAQAQILNADIRKELYLAIANFLVQVHKFLLVNVIPPKDLDDLLNWRKYWNEWIRDRPSQKKFIAGVGA